MHKMAVRRFITKGNTQVKKQNLSEPGSLLVTSPSCSQKVTTNLTVIEVHTRRHYDSVSPF